MPVQACNGVALSFTYPRRQRSSIIFVSTSNLIMVRWQCINDMAVRSTFDGPERNWEKEAVVYSNVPGKPTPRALVGTTAVSISNRTGVIQTHSCSRQPARKLHPLHWLRVCLGSAEVQKNAVNVFSVIRRKMVKTHRRKGEHGLSKMGGTSETSTQSLKHFDSSAVKNKKENALLRNLRVSRHCAHQHCSIQDEWRQYRSTLP